ncbi:hypothetical protein PHYBOEH_007729 [Phytophthora boehmeriae]|uniref:M96 mating-specific protein family n=1 Tax=Phytophthora boehmeriae TaxID=109152 RepID=A0A8T1X686_9STRA|nr:hypothetical protein PHYBOEH_007729 [Phytophthora boehmeriae]
MAFLEDDDALQALEEVLNYVEDFTLDHNAVEITTGTQLPIDNQLGIPSLSIANGDVSNASVASATTESGSSQAAPHNSESTGRPVSEITRERRRAAVNAKKRLLRKAGVYGNPNRARNERKLEIAYLREKVGQLEAELGQLKDESDQALAVTMTQKQEEGENARASDSEVEVSSIWKGLAARQRCRREKAERENVRLKLIVESQIKVAKSLESLLVKRAQQQMAECSSIQAPSADSSRPGRTFDFHTDAAEFQGLLEHLDAAYRDVDTVFTANGLADMEMTQQDVHMREGVDGMYLEVFSNKVIPFGLQATADATWNHFKGSGKHRGNLYAKEAQNLETPDTIIENFTKELFAGNSSTDVRVKQIVRRYVEAERVVVVWVATLTPVEIKRKTFEPYAGLTSYHRNYAVIKRPKASTTEQELSLLQLVSHASLDTKDGTIYDPKFVRALTDFLLSNAARNIKADQELIENVLMDQTLSS